MNARERAKHERALLKTFPNDGRPLLAVCAPGSRNVSFTGGYSGVVKTCEQYLRMLSDDGKSRRYTRIDLGDDRQSVGLFVGSASLVNGRVEIEL
jgi:hypothetical protein